MSLFDLPALVVAVLMWFQSPPVSLADAAGREALRRQMMPKAVRSLTDQDVDGLPRRPLPTLPEAPAASSAAATPPGPAAGKDGDKDADAHDETWWRTRIADLRKALDRDVLLADALQSRINGLTADWSARDDPAQRQQLFEARQRAIDELARMKDQIDADRKAMAELEELARRQNVPAGWIR